MRPFRPAADMVHTVIVVLIAVLLLKVLFAANPFDVIVLGGLIVVLVLKTTR